MDRELQILDYLSIKPQASQRELSMTTGVSLGQINSIIKKLVDAGLIRQDVLSKKFVKYVLTQRGIAEKARLSNEKIISTIKKYKKIKDSVANILSDLYNKGYREFVLEGEQGELYEVISDAFAIHLNGKADLIWGPANDKDNQVVLNMNRRFLNTKHVVNILHEIAL